MSTYHFGTAFILLALALAVFGAPFLAWAICAVIGYCLVTPPTTEDTKQ